MRTSHRCPKCRVGPILEIKGAGESSEERPLAGTAVGLCRNPDPKPYRPKFLSAGELVAYVCRNCGFTELYTLNPEDIHVDGDIVRQLGDKPAGPYR